MTLTHILVFAAAALLYLILLPPSWRKWALFAGSVIALYWLQPAVIIRKVDFIFPTATLALVGLSWLASRAPDQRWTREDTTAAAIMALVVVALSLSRFIQEAYRITPSYPPETLDVLIGVGGVIVLLAGLYRLPKRPVILAVMLLIVIVFVILKTTSLADEAKRALLNWQGQDRSLLPRASLEWLGFSYVAFRLIHTLRDRQSGKLPPLTLREYTTYAIFFPALTAGPIDRAQRFVADLQNLPGLEPARLTQGGMRIAVGIGKKFVIADSLAYFALNTTKAEQADSILGLWVLLYAYTLQIYFDFSGYTDIAIGIGQLFGIKLPENFNLPYLKRNITLFWQSWHMTLSQWVRDYVFLPLTRFLLKRKRKPTPTVLALIGQMTTMLVIGLWHGVTWGFIVWGLWHGIGLFIHKVYSDRTRMFYIRLRERPRQGQIIGAMGTLVTFHFVAIGWVWFALPDIETSWEIFLRLFGIT
jgi:D-alanyl-lipoteichoic acid acyltransferase DltB (MBOAT superfamily)